MFSRCNQKYTNPHTTKVFSQIQRAQPFGSPHFDSKRYFENSWTTYCSGIKVTFFTKMNKFSFMKVLPKIRTCKWWIFQEWEKLLPGVCLKHSFSLSFVLLEAKNNFSSLCHSYFYTILKYLTPLFGGGSLIVPFTFSGQ